MCAVYQYASNLSETERKEYIECKQLSASRSGRLKMGRQSTKARIKNIRLLQDNCKVKLLSPVVSCVFSKENTKSYYREHCGSLTNKKIADNYLDSSAV